MPQLDTSVFSPQLIWLAISFIALYLLMARVALPRISEVLEERQDRITDDLEEAEKRRNEAEAAMKAYETALAGARAEAHALGQQAREAAAAETARLAGKHETEMKTRLDEAEGRIRAAREAALSNLREVASEAAQAATRHLIGVEVSTEAAVRAVDAEGGGS